MPERRVVPADVQAKVNRIEALLWPRVPRASWFALKESELSRARVEASIHATHGGRACHATIMVDGPLGLAKDQHGPEFRRLTSWVEEEARDEEKHASRQR